MDLLGSILNSMDKPPSISEKQKEAIKKQKLELEKRQNAEKENLRKFRIKVEEKINQFLKDDTKTKYEFQPMDKIFRSIIHEVCEVAGLPTQSEGIDEERHIIVYKAEHFPLPAKSEEKAREPSPERTEPIQEPASNYRNKYAHLINNDDMKARSTMANTTYGIVPSENKRDVRSIEQTMKDIRARKRLKKEETYKDEAS
ncbi:sperm-associated antigen 7-like [Ctenocephalides felis]|uniref:sperm-associated antigen 7-like n=1 Tax=Ctenocephalides felis TaxID=7515 RepID=UPI000E6E2DFA|nr:sperm-associated antigen 7-like [Ctenocephalides felis]XP_026481115.1 sperm-associated antigen 7-like [Ctenocephalides felis]